MSTKTITAFGKPHRRSNTAHDGWIALSATAFAIGVLLLLTTLPAPRVDPAATYEPNATELVPGP